MPRMIPLAVPLCGLLLACSQPKSECAAAQDCGAVDTGSCTQCTPRASAYCEGGQCADKPEATCSLTMDVRMPNGVAVMSARFSVLDTRGANQVSGSAATVSCEDVRAEGMDAARFNVAQSGVKNTDTQNGVYTFFQAIPVGQVPATSQLLVVEGRSGSLGAGDRLAWGCLPISPSGSSAQFTVTLQAL